MFKLAPLELAATNGFTNTGTVTVASAGELAVASESYEQTAGQTIVDGTLNPNPGVVESTCWVVDFPVRATFLKTSVSAAGDIWPGQ